MSRAPSPEASRSSSPFIPKATPEALPEPLSSSKRECFPVSPSGLISRSRAAGTTSFGSGLPLPNGPRRSSWVGQVHADPVAPDADQRVDALGLDELLGADRLGCVLEEVAAEGVDANPPAAPAPRRPGARRGGSGAREQASSAAIRSKPGMLRAEPRATSPSIESRTVGRQWRSARREAAMPTTPGCQPSPARTSAAGLGQLGRLLAVARPRRRRRPRARSPAARSWPGRGRRRSTPPARGRRSASARRPRRRGRGARPR